MPLRVKLMVAFCVVLCGGFMLLFTLRVTGWGRAFRVPSNAMAPAFAVGDSCYATSLPLLWRKPIAGEIVVFTTAGITAIRTPNDEPQFWVQRLIALPGDRVQLVNDQIIINGSPSRSFKGHKPSPSNSGLDLNNEVIVPKSQCIVLGDNVTDSQDSRAWGFLPMENIQFVAIGE